MTATSTRRGVKRRVAAILSGLALVTVMWTHGQPRAAASLYEPDGYWMLGADYTVYGFGNATNAGDPHQLGGITDFGAHAVHIETWPYGTPYVNGRYLIVDNLGRVFLNGGPGPYGSAPNGWLAPGEQVTTLSVTPSGDGYWIFTDRGRVLGLGHAATFGDLSGVPLNGPIVGSIATPTGKGYYMVGSDGGIFAFGDAVFRGSMGGTRLNAPVESLVPSGDNRGYWLVASDGGIFAFGTAVFQGSMGGKPLNQPITGMIRYGFGYLMVAADGGIFNFSERPFSGSLGGSGSGTPIVSVAAAYPAGVVPVSPSPAP